MSSHRKRVFFSFFLCTAWACSGGGGAADDDEPVADTSAVDRGEETAEDIAEEDMAVPEEILAPFFLREVPPFGDLTAVGLADESFERKVLAASLQGVVNRTSVRLYLQAGEPEELNRWWEAVGEEASQRFWLEHYETTYDVTIAGEVDLDTALAQFASAAAGYVIASVDEPWTMAAATTIGGLENALIATEGDIAVLEALGLEEIDDLRGRWSSFDEATRDTFESLYPRANQDAIAILVPNEYRIRDFLIQNRIFTISGRPLGEGWASAQEVLNGTPQNIPLFGYLSLTGVEEVMAQQAISSSGKFLIPTDTTSNLSVHSAVSAELPEPRPIEPVECAFDTFRIAVAISDGDNMSIPTNRYVSTDYWLSESRGELPMGWSLAVGLPLLAPAMARFYTDGLTEVDELVAAFGIGYVYPTLLPDPAPYLEMSFEMMPHLGMTTMWHLDIGLYDRGEGLWDALSAAYVAGVLKGLILGFMGQESETYLMGEGLPVVQPGSQYEDTPTDMAARVRTDLESWRSHGGRNFAFVSAGIWTNSFAGLLDAFLPLAQEEDVTFMTPGQLLHCLAEEASEPRPTYRITSVEVEDYSTYRLLNDEIPDQTGDLWPCAWGADDRLYTANGDGMGFGSVWSDIVFSIVDGYPPDLVGSSPENAFGPYIATVWGPNPQEVSRKPTGLVCIDGDIYMFFQNLKNFMSDNVFGDAPHASISVTRDSGATWEFETEAPMFTDHVFTTGFFLDYGRCQEHAPDSWVYVYGLDYNWRFSDGFLQTEMFLARVPDDEILDRGAWEFFSGMEEGEPSWSSEIDDKTPVLDDDTIYCDDQSAIAQGSVVYLAPQNRYLYSSRAKCVWIFYEAPRPWGPWTKVSVIEWSGGWREDYHPGYNAVIPSKFVDEDGLGGWIISSLPDSWFDGTYYSMAFRRFDLEAELVTQD